VFITCTLFAGRIINRFTKDIGASDEYLPICIFDSLDIGFRMIGVIVIVIFSNPHMLFPAAVLLYSFGSLRNFFVKTSRSVKRIESNGTSACSFSKIFSEN